MSEQGAPCGTSTTTTATTCKGGEGTGSGGASGPEETGAQGVARSPPGFADTLLGQTVSEEVAALLAQARRQGGDACAADITLDGLLDRLAAWAEAEAAAEDGTTAGAARTGRGVDAFLATLPAALTAFRAGALVAVAKAALPAPWGADTGLPSDPGAVYARVVAPYAPRDRATTAVLRVACTAATDGADAAVLDVPLAHVARLPPGVGALVAGGAADRLVWDRAKAARLHAQHAVERSLLAALLEARGGYTAAEERLLSRVFLSDVPAAGAAVLAAHAALQRAADDLRALAEDKAQLAQLAARSRAAAGPAAADAADFAAVARSTVAAYLGVLAGMQQHARDVVEGVRSGATKRELTRWYLDLVHREADALLAAHGFAADAVPANYTEQPPACMAAVRRNQAVCHALLAGRATLPDVAAAVARTCRAVYARLDAFVLETMQVLQQDMGLAARADTLDDVPAFVAAAHARTREAEAAGEPLARAWRSATADIEYVCEMHRRENMAGGASMDIVPVSGLLLGRITRIENEMQTVVLIWDKPAAAAADATDKDTGKNTTAPGTPPAPRDTAKLSQAAPTQKRSFFRLHKEKRKDTSS